MTIALFAAGCSTMYGPEQISTPVVGSEGIKITVTESGDSSFVMKLSPVGEAAYYSYLVDVADAPEKLDSSLLYSVSYESVAQGTIKWTASEPEATIEIKDLTPNTTYQIYAVAGSVTGVPSSVAVTSVQTSDKVAPYITASEFQDSLVAVQFCENIIRAEEVSLEAKYYTILANDFSRPMGTLPIKEENITVNGNIVIINVEGLPANALYTVDLPEGAFKDPTGNRSEAVESAFMMIEGSLVPKGIYGQNATKTFALKAIEGTAFTDPEAYFMTSAEDPSVQIYNVDGTVIVKAAYELGGRTVSNVMTANEDYGLNSGYLMFFLPEIPDYGAKVTVTFPEGALYDIYGNSSKEFVFSQVLSYGYEIEDAIGNYSCEGTSIYDGAIYPFDINIEKSDDPEKGNVMITAFEYNCLAPLYADFDVDSGVISITDFLTPYAILSYPSGASYYLMLAIFDGSYYYEEPIELHLTAPGVISASGPVGLLLNAVGTTKLSVYDAYKNISGTRIESGQGLSLQTDGMLLRSPRGVVPKLK